jgi:hypothetical protein
MEMQRKIGKGKLAINDEASSYHIGQGSSSHNPNHSRVPQESDA